MSSFIKSVGVLLRWKRCAKFRTYKKLSCMLLPLMKALWQGEVRSFISGASRSARTLVIIFAIACMRLMGRKSRISSAPSFFGIRIMFALLKDHVNVWTTTVEYRATLPQRITCMKGGTGHHCNLLSRVQSKIEGVYTILI